MVTVNSVNEVTSDKKEINQKVWIMEGFKATDITTTGLIREDVCFQWKIENFSVLKENKTLIDLQRVTVKAGVSSGIPSEWQFYLRVKSADLGDGVGIFHRLIKPDIDKEGTISSKFFARIKTFDGNGNYANLETNLRLANASNKNRGFGWNDVIKRNCPIEEIPLINDCLNVDIRLSVFTLKGVPNAVNDAASAVTMLEKQARNNLLSRLESLYENRDEFSDMKIITKDKEEFFVHKAILSGGSPVMKAMFNSQMTEARTGVVRVNDISSNVMKIILHYIYTGKLLQDGLTSAENIHELAYAAEKYELLDLHKTCDALLTENWDMCSASKSLKMADGLRLEKTKSSIGQFIEKFKRK